MRAEQTAQKVTPTQALCEIEGMEEKKEGRREDKSKYTRRPSP